MSRSQSKKKAKAKAKSSAGSKRKGTRAAAPKKPKKAAATSGVRRKKKVSSRRATSSGGAAKRAAKRSGKRTVKKAATRRKATSTASRTASRRNGSSQRTKKRTAAPSDLYRVLGDDNKVSRRNDPGLPEELMLRMYRNMTLLRLLDERMLVMQRQGRVGFWGPTKGQEGATIGSCAAFEDRDWILPALREAGAALYRGYSLKDMICQCLGNAGERSLGRQMPCHYTFAEGNYVSMSSVIGTQMPHAVGVAMAAKSRGDDVVAAAYLGDGATSSSDFHTAMNFAGVYRAPCVFICQNNQWAISVPVSQQTASETMAQKAAAYGMEGVRVDGNDVLAVYTATRRAVEKARDGEGPTFLELLTYRVLGHSSSDDPTRYRDQTEVEYWTARDPLLRFREYLTHRKLWDAKREEELEGELSGAIAQAVREAEAEPDVAPESLIRDVYADVSPAAQEQLDRALDDLRG